MYAEYGPHSAMPAATPDPKRPIYFLQRHFLGEQDLLLILNTKRCRYQCSFCDLPRTSSKSLVPAEDVISQAAFVFQELRHTLSVVDRMTLSNNGSVLDADTFPREALFPIIMATHELRRLRTLVVETRLEFANPDVISALRSANPRARIIILTGFETVDAHIRDVVLGKRESIEAFLSGLDRIAVGGADLTAYVLYKPAPGMTDEEAYAEADASIHFLNVQCRKRSIALTVRLNPMYVARSSAWAKRAKAEVSYRPPSLRDALRLAQQWAQAGVPVYLGLSAEGLDEPWGTYSARADYSRPLLREALAHNARTPLTD